MGQVFKMEGPLYRAADTFCGMVLTGLLWMVCCIPVVTIGAATTAAYYTTAKVIRMQNGKVMQEFFRSFWMNFKDATLLHLIYLLFEGMAVYNIWQSTGTNEVQAGVLTGVWGTLLGLLVLLGVYTSIFQSRFTAGRLGIFKMALFAMFRHFIVTAAIGLLLVLYTLICYLWIPGILVIPGAWFLGVTYLIEPVMKRYMPRNEEEPQYDENGNRIQKWYEELVKDPVMKETNEDLNKKQMVYEKPKKQLHKYKKYSKK